MTLPSLIVSSIDQLSPEGSEICDDLLRSLLKREYPLRSILTVRKLRPSFWKLVFANNWNTALPNPRPLPFEPLTEKEYKGLPVGTYIAGAQPGRSKRPRQPAFLKVRFKENGGLFFSWFGESGAVVDDEDVEYYEGTTLNKLRADVINDWDEKEMGRVSEWNAKMIAFWGRQRLQSLVRSQNIDAVLMGGQRAQEGLVDGGERTGDLQNGRLCRRILQKTIMRERVEIGRMGKEERQNPRVSNLYGRRYVYSRLHEDDGHLERLREAKELLEEVSMKDLWFIW